MRNECGIVFRVLWIYTNTFLQIFHSPKGLSLDLKSHAGINPYRTMPYAYLMVLIILADFFLEQSRGGR